MIGDRLVVHRNHVCIPDTHTKKEKEMDIRQNVLMSRSSSSDMKLLVNFHYILQGIFKA